MTHSAKIAAILNCSVATIHTYRAQLRNAAIGDRNAFDDAIRRIDIAGAEPSRRPDGGTKPPLLGTLVDALPPFGSLRGTRRKIARRFFVAQPAADQDSLPAGKLLTRR